MSVKPLLLCLLLASPAAFAGNLSCHESPKPTGNQELDFIVTRYECNYTGKKIGTIKPIVVDNKGQ